MAHLFARGPTVCYKAIFQRNTLSVLQRRHSSTPRVAFVDTSLLIAFGGISNPLHTITKATLEKGYRLWYTPTVRREMGHRKIPEAFNRYPPRTGTVLDRLEDQDDILTARIPLPASSPMLETAITAQRLARIDNPVPDEALLSRRVLTISMMEEAFKDIWESHKHKDLTDEQKNGFRHDLFIVFEASYHMYDVEAGWNLGDPAPIFVTNNLKFFKRFINDPAAVAQLRHVIGAHGFESLIEVTTMANLVNNKVAASNSGA